MLLSNSFRNASVRSSALRLVRTFTAARACLEKPLPPRIVIPESDITEAFLKGTGPGGQKINKTSSAVQLKHLPTGIVVKCQDTRSREQNRRTARRLLSERLEDLEKGPQSRTAIKAEKASKKKASANKKARRKYRKLEEEKAAAGAQGGETGHNEDVVSEDTANVDDPSHYGGAAGGDVDTNGGGIRPER